MRPLVLFIATSLDGYIARPDGGIDWLFTDQDYGYTPFYTGVDTVVMGRKTYELSASFGDWPYPGKRAFVFTRSPRPTAAHARVVQDDPARFVADLKLREGKAIWLVGGAEIVAECLRADLVDEFVISVHPIVLGSGIALFASGLPERKLELVSTQRFDTGLVQLAYRRAK